MSISYAQQKALQALDDHNNDWGQAARALAAMAESDQVLLLELAAPYFAGMTAQAVQKAAKLQKTLAKPMPKKIVKPAPKPVSEETIWDVIINQMQVEDDPVAHEKTLRTMAKAFIEKRLDDRVAQRKEHKDD